MVVTNPLDGTAILFTTEDSFQALGGETGGCQSMKETRDIN